MHFGTLAEVQAGIATRRVKWDRDYQVKHGITTGPAEGLSEAEVEKLSHLAKRIYRALHMCGFARLDFRMRNDGKVFLLEANANPDLTFGEDFAESAESVGLGYKKLIGRIVSLGLNRRQSRERRAIALNIFINRLPRAWAVIRPADHDNTRHQNTIDFGHLSSGSRLAR
jgi:biotin carboxylase